MMHNLILLFSAVLLLFVASCTSVDKPVDEMSDATVDGAGNYRYAAWRPNNYSDFEAINILINEADDLIHRNEFNAAADKIERALRIRPEYAPAWSRLSWLALEMDSPQRCIQMAKRSNSFAYSDRILQSLNWSFIRTASKQLGDQSGYDKADQKINSLKPY
jgi:hypothetical protein